MKSKKTKMNTSSRSSHTQECQPYQSNLSQELSISHHSNLLKEDILAIQEGTMMTMANNSHQDTMNQKAKSMSLMEDIREEEVSTNQAEEEVEEVPLIKTPLGKKTEEEDSKNLTTIRMKITSTAKAEVQEEVSILTRDSIKTLRKTMIISIAKILAASMNQSLVHLQELQEIKELSEEEEEEISKEDSSPHSMMLMAQEKESSPTWEEANQETDQLIIVLEEAEVQHPLDREVKDPGKEAPTELLMTKRQ